MRIYILSVKNAMQANLRLITAIFVTFCKSAVLFSLLCLSQRSYTTQSANIFSLRYLFAHQSKSFFLIIFEVVFVDELLLCDVDLALTLSFSLSSTLLPCTSNLCVLTPIGVQVINVQ